MDRLIDRLADKDIKKSFIGVTNENSNENSNGAQDQSEDSVAPLKFDKQQLGVHVSTMGKEFLLQGFWIPQTDGGMGGGMRTRIVYFDIKGDKVYLFESIEGHQVGPEIPKTLILAQFDILNREDSYVVIDFNKGMSQIFYADEIHTSDFDGLAHRPSFDAVEVRYSYLDKIAFTSNRLEISQIAQLNLPDKGGSLDLTTVKIKYYLQPYKVNESFKASLAQSKRIFGFFEVAPRLLEGGRTEFFSTKFDQNKKIVYAISSNTPEKYRQAIKDGVLYWNKALGEDFLEVIDAPEGVSAPHIDYNIIQWVSRDRGGRAYADMQSDPRSGEILHSQIYIESGFAIYAEDAARSILLRMSDTENINKSFDKSQKASLEQISDHNHDTKPAPLRRFSIKGFESKFRCVYDVTDYLTNHVTDHLMHPFKETLVKKQANNESVVIRLAADYIRELVAHEVGHTMGLRHNFAGSHGINYPVSEREEVFKYYLKEEKNLEGKVHASSVMDYNTLYSSLMIGNQISKSQFLEYDEKAIKHLYLGTNYNTFDVPTFCTDSHLPAYNAKVYVDCKQFDRDGKSPAQESMYFTNRILKNLPKTTYNNVLLLLLSGYSAKLLPLIQSPYGWANAAIGERNAVFEALMNQSALIRVRRNYAYLSELYDEDLERQELAIIKDDIQKAGGIKKVFSSVDSNLSQQLYDQFFEIFSSPQAEQMRNLLAKSKETESTLEAVRNYFDLFQKYMVKSDLKLMGQENRRLYSGTAQDLKFRDGEVGEAMADLMLERILKYPFATKDSEGELVVDEVVGEKAFEEKAFEVAEDELVKEDVNFSFYVAPTPLYDLEIRQETMSLLGAQRGQTVDWGWEQRNRFNEEKDKYIERVLPGFNLQEDDLSKLPKPVRLWVLEWMGLGL